jgi:fatty acid desaturase (delta-4 desaturase)
MEPYSEYTIIDGIIYDLREFNHPTGPNFMICQGTDATYYYKSMHFHHDGYAAKVLKKFKVGELPTSYIEMRDEFALSLISLVGDTYANNIWWARTFIILASYYTLLFLSYNRSSTLMTILTFIGYGFSKLFIGLCIAHDANHGSVSKNKIISRVMTYSLSLLGHPKLVWEKFHNLEHHIFTNDYAQDSDTNSLEPLLVLHSPNKKNSTWFKKLLLLFIIPLYTFTKLYTCYFMNAITIDNSYIRNEKRIIRTIHSIIILYELIIPLTIFGHTHLYYYYLQQAVWSISIFLIFSVSHNFENVLEINSDNGKNIKQNWYKTQIETSSSYGGYISGLLTGGLNYQTEHHIFPKVNSIHYPHLHGRVREICAKYNVKYTYFPTIIDNIRSTLKYLNTN